MSENRQDMPRGMREKKHSGGIAASLTSAAKRNLLMRGHSWRAFARHVDRPLRHEKPLF
jgi:hypothetical protein